MQCFWKRDGRLAQLVQSVCLTSRGSGVRIPQRPHPFVSPFNATKFRPWRGSSLPRGTWPVDFPKGKRVIYNSRLTMRNRRLRHSLPTSFFSRALSSAGSERLPYKQRVGGSNPSAPTPQRGVSISLTQLSFFTLPAYLHRRRCKYGRTGRKKRWN